MPMVSDALPGAELVQQGLHDLAHGRLSIEALLVLVGAPRLRTVGLKIPRAEVRDPELALYEKLAESDPDSAHSRYNALVRTLVSFERARPMRRPLDLERLRQFMRALGQRAERPGRIYFTGGASALIEGWRSSTVHVDIKVVPEQDAIFRALPELKERLEMNVELASPDDFIPELSGWEERSRFIAQEGVLAFHHYDFYAQALSKLERGHARDMADVEEFARRGLIAPDRLLHLFEQVEGQLYRFPALDPPSFRRTVEDFVSRHRADRGSEPT